MKIKKETISIIGLILIIIITFVCSYLTFRYESTIWKTTDDKWLNLYQDDKLTFYITIVFMFSLLYPIIQVAFNKDFDIKKFKNYIWLIILSLTFIFLTIFSFIH